MAAVIAILRSGPHPSPASPEHSQPRNHCRGGLPEVIPVWAPPNCRRHRIGRTRLTYGTPGDAPGLPAFVCTVHCPGGGHEVGRRFDFLRSLILFVTVLPGASSDALADVMEISDPSAPTEIGARIRWGGNRFEGSVFDGNPVRHLATLNPSGSPVWQLNVPYLFEVSFDSATGALGLAVDFNQDNVFGAGETVSRSLFVTPGLTSYLDYGFRYLSISGNERGSTARSQLTNLTINGTALPDITPNGNLVQRFYGDSAGEVLGPDIRMTGNLTYLTAGTAQERPSWNFNLKQAEELPLGGSGSGGAAVPEPGSMALLGLCTLLAAGRSWPRFAKVAEKQRRRR